MGSELTSPIDLHSAKSSSVETRILVCSKRSRGSPALRRAAGIDTPISFSLSARRPGTRKCFNMRELPNRIVTKQSWPCYAKDDKAPANDDILLSKTVVIGRKIDVFCRARFRRHG